MTAYFSSQPSARFTPGLSLGKCRRIFLPNFRPRIKKNLIAAHAAEPCGKKQRRDINQSTLCGHPSENNESFTFKRRPHKNDQIKQVAILVNELIDLLHSREPGIRGQKAGI